MKAFIEIQIQMYLSGSSSVSKEKLISLIKMFYSDNDAQKLLAEVE